MSLDEIKLSLNITWDDELTNQKVSDTYTAAEALINDYAGVTVDYSSDKIAAQLLKDCVRYIWNEVSDEFEPRYSSQLIALRNKYEVISYAVSE